LTIIIKEDLNTWKTYEWPLAWNKEQNQIDCFSLINRARPYFGIDYPYFAHVTFSRAVKTFVDLILKDGILHKSPNWKNFIAITNEP
jgi:hypothetical protein